MNWIEILIAVLPPLATLVGVLLSNQKTANLTIYRIEQLEKKVEKHNSIVERTYSLEGKVETIEKELNNN